jgi:hypothetical protein
MTPELVLFLLRLLSAALLLGFFGALLYFLYRDLQVASTASESFMTPKGFLRVIASESGRPAPDTAYPLLPVTTIGRHRGNTIVLNDGFVSGRHAVLAQRETGWWLEDLGSRNGTLLNTLLLTDGAVVSAGDVITVGGVQLRIELPQIEQTNNTGESQISPVQESVP